MITLALYSAIKEYLQSIDNDMSISFNFLNYELSNTMSINIKSYSNEYVLYNGAHAVAPGETYKELPPYANNVSRVQIVIQQEYKDTYDGGMFDLLRKGQKVKYLLQKLYNKVLVTESQYTIDENDEIIVDRISGNGIDVLISDTNSIGGPIQLDDRAPEGKLLVSLNCTISYSLIGNHNTGDTDDNSSIINDNTETTDTEPADNSEDQSGTE